MVTYQYDWMTPPGSRGWNKTTGTLNEFGLPIVAGPATGYSPYEPVGEQTVSGPELFVKRRDPITKKNYVDYRAKKTGMPATPLMRRFAKGWLNTKDGRRAIKQANREQKSQMRQVYTR